MTPIELGQADKVKVFDLVEHLRKAFEQFFENEQTFEQPITYSRVDVFMAAHNFHKLIVCNLVEGLSVEERNMFLQMSAYTFELAMKEERAKS